MSIFKKKVSSDNEDGAIRSFDIVTLRESGMRYTVEYEMVMKDGNAEVSLYTIKYSRHECCRNLERRAVCSAGAALKLLNDCRLLSWDGFDGPHPKGVLDGIMFEFQASVNDGKRITACGSENFPQHYRELTDGIYARSGDGLLYDTEEAYSDCLAT